MRFEATSLPGAFLVEAERFEDERGFFAATFAPDEFAGKGLDARVAQAALAWNRRRGTLRGLHYQAEPHAQAKLVRCPRGAIWDVIVDLRPGPTQRRWFAAELTAANGRQLFVPAGCAHGYLTLADDSEVVYQLSTPWTPAAERGLRWDDPALQIAWPLRPEVISARDAALPTWGQP